MNAPAWARLDGDVAAVLDEYETRGRSDQADQTGSFAATFLALDPHRAGAVTATVLAAALPGRRRAFAARASGSSRASRHARCALTTTTS